VNWSRFRVRRTVSSCDRGGRLNILFIWVPAERLSVRV
jgi:hypothetical protein